MGDKEGNGAVLRSDLTTGKTENIFTYYKGDPTRTGNVLMDGCTREMKAKVGKVGVRLKLNVVDWSVAACLSVNETVLLAESERELQRVVDQFHSVCRRKKLRVNAGKSKVMIFERKEVEVVNFGNPYMVSASVEERYEIVMGGERMEVVRV